MTRKGKKDNELMLTREFSAPRKVVWDAWTDPAQVALWWGPRGFTLTTHSRDLRTDGHWRYTMHGPDGTDYPNVTHYLEVVPMEKLVYDHGATESTPPLFRVTVHFSDHGDTTGMEMTMALSSPEAAQEIQKFIKRAGGDSTWDRLAEYVDTKITGRRSFSISRSFNTPIDTMYDRWSKPEHFSRWLPPSGFAMEFIRTELRVGGTSFYTMTGANGTRMFGRVKYVDFSPPSRIRYTQEFCDENENLSRHPLAPIWPATMLTTVDLVDEGMGFTRVTVTWEPYGDVTPDELEVFTMARAGMTAGWTGSFDKLDELLEE